MDRFERIETMYKYIQDKRNVSVKELSRVFGISEVTVRKDLQEIEANGLIKKTHGYARASSERLLLEPKYADKASRNTESKKLIAKKSAEFLDNEDIIFMSTGSTINLMCNYIDPDIRITVITNDIKNAFELALFPNVKLIIPNGECRQGTYSMIGSSVYQSLSRFHVSKAFLSCSAYSAESGLFTTIYDSAQINSVMIQNSGKIYLLADSTKYRQEAMVQIAPMEAIDYLITDNGFPREDIGKFQAYNTEVIIVE